MVLTLSSATNIIDPDINLSEVHYFKGHKDFCSTLPISITAGGWDVVSDWPEFLKLLVIYINCLTKWHKFDVFIFGVSVEKEEETWQNKIDTID